MKIAVLHEPLAQRDLNDWGAPEQMLDGNSHTQESCCWGRRAHRSAATGNARRVTGGGPRRRVLPLP